MKKNLNVLNKELRCVERNFPSYKVYDKDGKDILKFRNLDINDFIPEWMYINNKIQIEEEFCNLINEKVINFVDNLNRSASADDILARVQDFIIMKAQHELDTKFDIQDVMIDITMTFYHRKNIRKEVTFYSIREYILKNFMDWSEFLIQPKIIYGDSIRKDSERSKIIPNGLEELKLRDLNKIFEHSNFGLYKMHQLPIFKKEYELTPRQTFIVMSEIIYQSENSESEIHRLWQMNNCLFGLTDGWALILFQNYFSKIGFKVRFIFEGKSLASTKIFFKEII